MIMKIITITLNPAYDVYWNINSFTPYGENYVTSSSVSVGGKGINISRVLKSVGFDSIAYAIIGKENSGPFKDALVDEGISSKTFETDGKIRENVPIITEDKPETRVSFSNFMINESYLHKIAHELDKDCDRDTIVAFSGRLPQGISVAAACDFIHHIRKITDFIVLDCNTFSINDIQQLRPWLIKPNKREAEILYGAKIENMSDAIEAATYMSEKGCANVLITLGKNGAVYTDGNIIRTVNAPKIKLVSSVGAGDATVAGFCRAYASGCDIDQCLKEAITMGTATCLQPGTNPPLIDDIRKILGQVDITVIK